jgi:hypothetical protein
MNALENCQTVPLVIPCELFWNPSCTNFMKEKSVVDDSMSKTMTNAQMMHNFINTNPSVT